MERQEDLLEMLRKQTQALDKLARPYVITDVYPRRSVNMLYFRIRNVGLTPAFNVQAHIQPPIPFGRRMSSDLNIFDRPIGVLGPREEISFFFDSAIELFRKEDSILSFEVQIYYTDVGETPYEQAIRIDIDLLKHLSIELPASDRVLDELELIKRHLQEIARYVETLRHKEMQERWKAPTASRGEDDDALKNKE